MPVTPTYPGVYIEEIPSGVRTITGVATSITAFMGRALYGPVSEPILVNNFGEFEQAFGGLHVDCPMSYAVRDFYLNGGSQALIIRLFNNPFLREAENTAKSAVTAVVAAVRTSTATEVAVLIQEIRDAAQFDEEPGKTAADTIVQAAVTASEAEGATVESVKRAATARSLSEDAIDAGLKAATIRSAKANLIIPGSGEDAEPLTLEAANPGKWGNNLQVVVNYTGIDSEVADRYGLAETNLFNLVVTEVDRLGNPKVVETIRNVTVVESSRRLDRVLKEESQLVRVLEDKQLQPILPPIRPPENPKNDDEQIIPIKVESEENQGIDSDSLDPQLDYVGSERAKTGLYALEKADLFNLLCIPPDVRDGDTDPGVYTEALKYCVRRRAILIVDSPMNWGANKETAANKAKRELNNFLTSIGATNPSGRNAALYFPRVIQADPLREGQQDVFVPCGIIAGIMARTDVQRGVWKAPAGIDAGLTGIRGLQVELSNDENGLLNPLGVNCLRNFPPVYGRVVWGARTLRGADQLADEYKYLPVRRMLLYLQESLYRGTQWVVFEPNDEPLWAQIRQNINAFMNNLFRQGAFQGKSPKDAYFVKCDSETTTQYDIDRGIVNIVVGFAPLKPAEFVILKFQQITRQTEG